MIIKGVKHKRNLNKEATAKSRKYAIERIKNKDIEDKEDLIILIENGTQRFVDNVITENTRSLTRSRRKKAKELVKDNRRIKPLEKMKLWSKIERINGTELEELIQELKKIEKKKKYKK